MMNLSHTVPFKISGINHGLQEAKGLLKLKEEGIVLEFEVTDSLIGAMKSGVKEVEIQYGDLLSIQFKKGLFSHRIILEGKSMKTFDDLPGVEVAMCTLNIKRNDKKKAGNVASKAQVALSEVRLKEMNNHSSSD